MPDVYVAHAGEELLFVVVPVVVLVLVMAWLNRRPPDE